jgi:predicted ATP-grasp superfamily ATP-dependent carboligase
VLEWADARTQPDELAQTLTGFATAQPERPVLYYDEDGHLGFISRNRERLQQGFRFLLPDRDLVEDVLDKGRFQALSERLELPVPRGRRLLPVAESPPSSELDLRFPVILKPLTHSWAAWRPLAGDAKALGADTPRALRDLWPRMAATGLEFLAQELVPGPETRIESYHVYVDPAGEIAAEFTGRKIRTYPSTYGLSSALTITDSEDVARVGRELTGRVGLRGVAKLDFKRAPDGSLYLLEINPRFNLWHHLGAKAGVNLPALVHADLVGLPRPSVRAARSGTRWCHRRDLRAAKLHGISLVRWVPWAITCEAKSGVAWDDPMPFLRGLLWRRLRRVSRIRGRPARAPS